MYYKITTKIIVLLVVVGALVVINNYNSAKCQLTSMALNNIEALAESEGGNLIECFGTGSIDCPITKTNTAIVIRSTSIINIY